ncbi:uncharacterized protein LOC133348791 [Lethenteron reissneri]|uniref:uncharacterized protein LOC133348791 n=1 Tax=Lethenteron reissneri TaxID=7753 RepID=UPI002AB7347A|nr:uncharacterized protein LOC133348791 [Lethenteron reissneri]XP_061417783.1 uncharacterized protein LOC133348791 [Lethenteron reissneri]
MPGDDDLSCQICCEHYDEDTHSPRILGCCLYNLCLQCAKNLESEQEGFVACPACRTEHDVEGDAENLPVNELVLRRLRAAPPPGGGGGDFDADAPGVAARGFIEGDEWSVYSDDDDLYEERFERADVVPPRRSASINIDDYDFYEEPSESPDILAPQGFVSGDIDDYDFYEERADVVAPGRSTTVTTAGHDFYEEPSESPDIPAEVPAASDQEDTDEHLALPTCPLCDYHFDTLRKPWALACPHVLCEPCLSAMHGSRSPSGARISCPVCATETDVAHDWTACVTPRGHSGRHQRPQPAAPDPLGPAAAGNPGAVVVTSGAADDGSEGSFWARWLATLRRWCFCRAR